MNSKNSKITSRWLYIFANILLLLFLVVVYHQISASFNKQVKLSQDMLLQEAKAHFDNMLITRSWNSLHGGLYYKAKPGEKPNPYLPQNMIYSKDNDLLIRVNPAWMTRQISELSNKKSKYYYKITSLKPINPNNVPVGFEIEALKFFEKHPDTKYYYKVNDTLSKFDFMGKLSVEKSCLQCHAQQNYKLGDVRGGIRVSIPTSLYQEKLQDIKYDAFIAKLISFLGYLLTFYFLNRTIFLNSRYQIHIEGLNDELEEKVQERTEKLELMYNHEKYLKELLETTADVSELLISSYTVESIVKNSIERLNRHPSYSGLWMGFLENNILSITQSSFENFNEQTFNIDEEYHNIELQKIKEAIEKKTYILQNIQHKENLFFDNTLDNGAQWLLLLPMMSKNNEDVLGVLSVYSNRENGFQQEEIKMLANLATDIAIAIYTLLQRTMLQAMEIDKIQNYEETILAFVTIIEERDSYTAGHTSRVARYCRLLAKELGVAEEDIVKLEKAAILHDIGKVATPDAILLKPGKLTILEYELIKQHAEAGYKMLSKINRYKHLAELTRYHHVRYDGKGYPKTSSPDEVPFLSHIMALADAFDAMTSNRIYKPRQSLQQALVEIEKMSGTQFHPEVAKVAYQALKDVKIETTQQLPINELEQKRFAYFFEDSLIGCYNESYLQVSLANAQRSTNNLCIFYLKHFTKLNRKEGWNAGNAFLVKFAQMLQEKHPDALLFRYRGDDFVLLKKDAIEIDIDALNQLDFIASSEIKIGIKQISLQAQNYEIDLLDSLI